MEKHGQTKIMMNEIFYLKKIVFKQNIADFKHTITLYIVKTNKIPLKLHALLEIYLI